MTLLELKNGIIRTFLSMQHETEFDEFTFITPNPNISKNHVKIKAKDNGQESIGLWSVDTIASRNEVIMMIKSLNGHILIKQVHKILFT
jgi:hypothetical protein